MGHPLTYEEGLLFIDQQPGLYEEFERFALKAWRAWKDGGAKPVGAEVIRGRVRYEAAIEKKGEFKVNNNLTPFLARKFMDQQPQCEGFFKLRELKREKMAREFAEQVGESFEVGDQPGLFDDGEAA